MAFLYTVRCQIITGCLSIMLKTIKTTLGEAWAMLNTVNIVSCLFVTLVSVVFILLSTWIYTRFSFEVIPSLMMYGAKQPFLELLLVLSVMIYFL
jgi:hypothetical protein